MIDSHWKRDLSMKIQDLRNKISYYEIIIYLLEDDTATNIDSRLDDHFKDDSDWARERLITS